MVQVLKKHLKVFLKFAVNAGAIDDDEYKILWRTGWASIGAAAKRQRVFQKSEDPALRFLNLLVAALAAGRVHLEDLTHGGPPDNSSRCGWRDGRPSGYKIGWVSDERDEICLDPEGAYAEIQKFANDQHNPISVTKETLFKHLAAAGLLVISAKEGKNTQKRTTPDATRKRLLIFKQSVLGWTNEQRRRSENDNESAQVSNGYNGGYAPDAPIAPRNNQGVH